MDRSIALLKSLGIERERWEATSETFKSQMATIIGDVLLSSAYLAYAGYFDQHVRFKNKQKILPLISVCLFEKSKHLIIII